MQPSGGNLSVLLVEGEILISLDICESLTAAGYCVIGPANTVSGAQFLLQRHTPDVAIVDILLRDGKSTEVVQQLGRRKVPFLVHSRGPQHEIAASDYGHALWLAKPAFPADLLTLLGKICQPEMV